MQSGCFVSLRYMKWWVRLTVNSLRATPSRQITSPLTSTDLISTWLDDVMHGHSVLSDFILSTNDSETSAYLSDTLTLEIYLRRDVISHHCSVNSTAVTSSRSKIEEVAEFCRWWMKALWAPMVGCIGNGVPSLRNGEGLRKVLCPSFEFLYIFISLEMACFPRCYFKSSCICLCIE